MFGRQSFVNCINTSLSQKGFGEKRKAEVLEIFERKVKEYDRQGIGSDTASFQAMRDTMDEVAFLAVERAKRAAKTIHVQADVNERLLKGVNVQTARLIDASGTKNSRGVSLGRAAISFLQADPRFSGLDFTAVKEGYTGRYRALFSDVMEHFSKGAFGTQKGAAHLPNVVREMFGANSGDDIAKQIATSYKKLQGLMIEDFNRAGGSMRKLMDFNMPQMQNAVKVTKAGFDKWAEQHMKWLDWGKMRWPNGDLIQPDERMAALKEVYGTFATEGATKIKPGALGGRGTSVGNTLENHRFLVYKDADAWLDMHTTYSDGSVFDVVMGHLDNMAHKTALVQMFGPTPETFRQTIHNAVRREAAGLVANPGRVKDKYAVVDADVVLGRFDNMFDTITRQNAMNPHNPFAAGVVGASNILTGAQLGSASILAVFGDFHTTLTTRFLNHMPLLDGIGTYLKGMTVDYKAAERIAARAGFTFDETVMSTYAAERFTGIGTIGPAVTRATGDAIMRLSGLNRHTSIARWTATKEHMGFLEEMRKTPFDQLPNRMVMERYGITASEWDDVRKNVPAWEPGEGATFMRPLDILESNLSNKETLYRKFFGMIMTESRNMVPGSTVEAQTMLRGTSRPDSMPGALLHSFAMYKNFPLSMMMTYGRLAMSENAVGRRIGYIASLGLGMTAVGAMGTQLREISKGKEPMPMDRAGFWGKALLSGGALSIWGDFLFSNVNEFGRTKGEMFAGPLAGLATDMANLALGPTYAAVAAYDKDKKWDSNFAARAVEFAKRNTPGTSLWWARLALEREIWDRMQEWADPQAYRKQADKVRKQRMDYGNEFFSRPGQRLFTQR